MTLRDRMDFIALAVKALDDVMKEYAPAKGEAGNRPLYAGYDVPMHSSKEAIARRIKQLRQDLLLLEKEL